MTPQQSKGGGVVGIIILVLVCILGVIAINRQQYVFRKIENDAFVEGWCTEVVRHHEREGAIDRIQCYSKFPEMEIR